MFFFCSEAPSLLFANQIFATCKIRKITLMKDLAIDKGNSMKGVGDGGVVTFEHLNVVEAMKSEENKGKHEERNAERICDVLFFFPTHVAENLHYRML